MSARAASGLLVSAMIRRVEATGGHGMVLAKGDATAGAILLVIAERGMTLRIIERAMDFEGRYRWAVTGPAELGDSIVLGEYLGRRRRNDPDLWVVELDSPDAEAIAGELL